MPDATESAAPVPVDPLVKDLIDDMMRLGMRQYSEVGIPMFLIAEDLRAEAAPAPVPAGPPIHWRDVAMLFSYRADMLRAQNPEFDAADVARLVEVFADRYLIATTVPSFSAIPDMMARRRGDGDEA